MELIPVPFDSELFGVRVYRANDITLDTDLSCCDLLYVFTEKNIPEEVLAKHGGTLVDLRRVYKRTFAAPISLPVPLPSPGLSFASLEERPLRPNERERLIELCLQSGINSRYFRDPRIPKEWYRRFYRTWMENSLKGEMAYAIMTARLHGVLQGFITLREVGPNTTNLSLVGVAEGLRGKGIGTALLIASMNYVMAKRYHTEITVVTHGHNEPLCRFYERQGFTLVEAQNVYHFWPPHNRRA